jgi:sterol desaturase/sphingolipid hydroxylase (fatty acid hydroxylase superfamily)
MFHHALASLLHNHFVAASLDALTGGHRARLEKFLFDVQAAILPDEGRMRPMFLSLFLLVALISYAVTAGRGQHPGQVTPAASRSVWRYLFPGAVYGHRSAVLDYKLYLANGLLKGFLNFSTLILSTGIAAAATHRALTSLLGPRAAAAGGPPLWLCLLFMVALLAANDLGFFVAHLLEHKVPFLWSFHKVHHSAEVLTPITAFRNHPVEKILEGAWMAAFAGATGGLFRYASGHEMIMVLILGESVIKFSFEVTNHFRHSHFWVPFPRALSHLFTSPAMHLVHHSVEERHIDKNFAAYFGLWDWTLGTLYVPGTSVEERSFKLGLGEGATEHYRSLPDCYLRPFREVAGDLARRIAAIAGRLAPAAIRKRLARQAATSDRVPQ